MSEREVRVTFKGKKTSLTLKIEDEEVRGYVNGKTHVVTFEVDGDSVDETFCHDDLDYAEKEMLKAVSELIQAAESEDEESGDEESEDEESDDDEDEDEEDDEDDEDEDEDEEDDEDEDEDEDEEDEEDEEDDDDEDEDEEDEDEEDEEDDEDEEDEDEESEDAESDEEVDEDENADYGEPVKFAGIPNVPTVHAVLVAYGSGIDVDGDVRLLRKLLGTLQQTKVANVRETLLHGAEATGKKALATVAGLKTAADDVVWFYYSGHGCMEDRERYLCTHGKLVRRGAVVDAVNAKEARLKVVLSDCCASDGGRLSPEEKMGAGRHGVSPERLRKLFVDSRGLFDASSSSDYQYSFGGVFTPALVDKVILKGQEQTWREVFDRTQQIAMSDTEGALPKEAKAKLRKLGLKVEDRQKPIVFSLPED